MQFILTSAARASATSSLFLLSSRRQMRRRERKRNGFSQPHISSSAPFDLTCAQPKTHTINIPLQSLLTLYKLAHCVRHARSQYSVRRALYRPLVSPFMCVFQSQKVANIFILVPPRQR